MIQHISFMRRVRQDIFAVLSACVGFQLSVETLFFCKRRVNPRLAAGGGSVPGRGFDERPRRRASSRARPQRDAWSPRLISGALLNCSFYRSGECACAHHNAWLGALIPAEKTLNGLTGSLLKSVALHYAWVMCCSALISFEISEKCLWNLCICRTAGTFK